MIGRLFRYLQKMDNQLFISHLFFISLFAIWFINPGVKLIMSIFLLILLFVYLKTKNIYHSLVLTYLLSSIIYFGKTYYFQVLDLKVYPYLKELYPLGYFVPVVITPSDVLILLMVVFLIRALYLRRIPFSLDAIQIVLILWFFVRILSSIFASKRVFLSLYISSDSIHFFIIYTYIKYFFLEKKALLLICYTLLVIIFFQNYVAARQFINSSTLGKNIEHQFGTTSFGTAADEYFFAYRPNGTFFHANNLGVYLSSLIPFFFSLWLLLKNDYFLLGSVISLAIVIITLSRSAWLSLFVALTFYFYLLEYKLKYTLWPKFKKFLVPSLLLFIPLFWYAMPRIARTVYTFDSSGGLTVRVRQIGEAFDLLKLSPLLGVGPGMDLVAALENQPHGVFAGFPAAIHNFYMDVAVENGLIGLSCLLIFLFLYLKAFVSLFRLTTKKSTKTNLIGILAASLVLIIAAFSQPFLDLLSLVIFYHMRNLFEV